jgi:hypothetical protein
MGAINGVAARGGTTRVSWTIVNELESFVFS